MEKTIITYLVWPERALVDYLHGSLCCGRRLAFLGTSDIVSFGSLAQEFLEVSSLKQLGYRLSEVSITPRVVAVRPMKFAPKVFVPSLRVGSKWLRELHSLISRTAAISRSGLTIKQYPESAGASLTAYMTGFISS